MPSKVEICNLALARVGHRTIANFDEVSAEGNYCRQFYDIDRREVLRVHPWNFSVKVAAMAQSTEDPVYGYLYRYQLPSDCIRPLELTNLATVSTASTAVNSSGEVYQLTTSIAQVPQVAYKIVGRELMTNMEDAKLAYVSDETNTIIFSETFVNALAFRLAADFAAVIVKNAAMQKNMVQMYQMALLDAKGVDASENKDATAETVLSVRG